MEELPFYLKMETPMKGRFLMDFCMEKDYLDGKIM